MKKLLKIILVLALIVLIFTVAALAVLRWMFPSERLKQIAMDYTRKNFQREISFDRASLGLQGLTLDNFALSESTTFEQGTFIKATKVQVDLSWLALLHKQIKIETINVDGLEISIISKPDGSFNFDDLTSGDSSSEDAHTAAEETPFGFALTAEQFVATNCKFSYKDLNSSTNTDFNNINFDIRNFDLSQPFQAIITFVVQIDQINTATLTLPATIDLTVFLADLNLSQAYVTLNQATASYKNVQLLLNGKIENFEKPNLMLKGTLSGINQTTFIDFLPDLPPFTLPEMSINIAALADIEQSSAQISQAEIRLQDSRISVSGPLNWGGASPTYTLKGNTNINIEQAVKMTDTLDFRPTGTISGSFKATEKKDYQDVSGTFQLRNVSLIYDPFTLTQTNGTIKMASLDDISSNNLTGLLNGEKITASFSYKEEKNIPSYVFNADLAKLTLNRFPGSTETSETTNEIPTAQTPAPASNETESFYNVKANLKIGEISVPYMRANGLVLNADLTRVSSSMSQANGTASFALQPGAVTDIDTLLKGNKVVRFLLLPFGIINSVAKKLNITLFDATSSARKGEIAFTGAEGDYVFNNGIMTINNTSFISDLTNLKGSGTIDFPADKLNMKVSASVLTKQTSMVIKIGGTLENPSGKLDVLNTVGSVVGGLLNYKTATGLATGTVKTAGHITGGAAKTTGHAAEATLKGTTDAAKATVKAIGSIFKKKKEDSSADETSPQKATASEPSTGQN